MNIFVSLIIFLSLFFSPVLADEDDKRESPTPSISPYTGEIKKLKEGVQEFRQNVKTEKTKVKTQVKSLKNANEEELEKRKEELKEEADEKRENIFHIKREKEEKNIF